MTGPEHYLAAQRLLDTEPFCTHDRLDCEHRAVQVATAQVHATLALAAATAMGLDMAHADFVAWNQAAGESLRIDGQQS